MSRKTIATLTDDADNRAFFVEERKEFFEKILKNHHRDGYITTLFGELIGKGIQKGCAIHELDRRFVVFAIKYTNINDETDCQYIKPDGIKNHDLDIYNIFDFKTYTIDIDFTKPEVARNKIVEWVEAVEAQCPFGKHFGVDGIGEGIVFSSYDENGIRQHTFKAKGEKHSKSKVKNIVPVDIEKVNNVKAFIEYAVTEARLEQGVDEVFGGVDPVIERTGDFVKWMVKDVIEEEIETLVDSKLTPKDVSSSIGKSSVRWFKGLLDKLAFG